MTKHWQFWVLSVIGAACAVFVGVNIVLSSRNQALQTNADRRNQYIQQSVQLQGLYRQIVKAVATLSVRDNDPQLRAVLAKQGITVTMRQSAATNTGSSENKPKPRDDGRTGGAHDE